MVISPNFSFKLSVQRVNRQPWLVKAPNNYVPQPTVNAFLQRVHQEGLVLTSSHHQS